MFNRVRELPPRIEHFVMDIQEYAYEVQYKPGCANMADCISRHPVPRKGTSLVEQLETEVKVLVLTEETR